MNLTVSDIVAGVNEQNIIAIHICIYADGWTAESTIKASTLLDKVMSCRHGNYDAKHSHLMFN